jgi:hypothetical protein
MLKATKGSSRMDIPETLPTLGNQDTGHGETKTHNTTQIKKRTIRTLPEQQRRKFLFLV